MGERTLTRAIFLDRDGVLNEAIVRDGKPYAPSDTEELRVFPDAAESLRRLKSAGYLLIVVTNQPEVGRGNLSQESVEMIHASMAADMPIDEFVVCYHSGAEDCSCRKPKPGMVLDAASRYEIDLANSFLIGDRWRDVDCGAAAGVRTVWIDRGYRERGPSQPADHRCGSITEAVSWILAEPERAAGV
jgi:D-glycero-D-manno-heptose 1,7-bisphosphate phosphatase